MKVSTPASRSLAAIKAAATRKSPQYRASKSEKDSKEALAHWCKENGWRVVFFEGPTWRPAQWDRRRHYRAHQTKKSGSP